MNCENDADLATLRISRRSMLGLTAAAAATLCRPFRTFAAAARFPEKPSADTKETIVLGQGAVQVTFERHGLRLTLIQIQRNGNPPLLYTDNTLSEAGSGPVGNPFAMVLLSGPSQGVHTMNDFQLTGLERSEERLLAYFTHEQLPMQIGIEASVEGDVITWSGQVVWNGADDLDADFYFPLLSRIRFDSPERDRLIAGELSGTMKQPLSSINFSQTYLGGLSTPCYMVEGAGRGLAFLEDSRADFTADPGACRQRSAVVGTQFPLPDDGDAAHALPAGKDGPFAGWRHRRLLLGASRFGGKQVYDEAESHSTLPLLKLGDSVDLGPVLTYAYNGTWKSGATWLREKRQWLPFRVSPASWYAGTTFLAEDFGDRIVRSGMNLYDLPLLLQEKHAFGSDMLSLPGYSQPEIIGTHEDMLNRGDYFYPAEDMGGLEAMQHGVEATHRQGGRILLYLEGLIVWKRSRIGRYKAADWALKDANGAFTENYRGFFDMCPAEPGWQDWFATTLANIVKETGVDGFFMDSMLATDNHRCFNPHHAHAPQPDIWNWGLRRILKRVREEVDKANPNTILLCEGVGDIAREYIDGSLSHGHAWSRMTFTVPLLRFMHPNMRAFEAWGLEPKAKDAPVWPVAKSLLWNAVQGYRIFAEQESHEQLTELGHRIRGYYDMYPEICDAPVSMFNVEAGDLLTQLFESAPRVMTVGNASDSPVTTTLQLPSEVQSGLLFDRCDQKKVSVIANKVELSLQPWEYRAFELRA